MPPLAPLVSRYNKKISRRKVPTRADRVRQYGRRHYYWYGKFIGVNADTSPEDILEGDQSFKLKRKRETKKARKLVWKELGWDWEANGPKEHDQLHDAEEETEARKLAEKMVGGRVLGSRNGQMGFGGDGECTG
ncbi:Hypothetical predicted protein [Lecanosticta acicola]|uniref:Uncharacterized protein n=1 Tax=Lecanosticta acicola TaxID=111012 RepID=A0AAI8Z5T5_9PEZI|nr:Hypothetical predicted protein [Lecanosticta acicola]